MIGYYFKPFSRLDLHELIYLKAEDEEKNYNIMSKSATLSEVYGLTAFESLYHGKNTLENSLAYIRL